MDRDESLLLGDVFADDLDLDERSFHTQDCGDMSHSTSNSLEKSGRRIHRRLSRPPNAILCSMCQSMFDGRIYRGDASAGFDSWYQHHSSSASVRKAAAKRCVICKVIENSLVEITGDPNREWEDKSIDLRWIIYHFTFKYHLEIKSRYGYSIVHWILENGEVLESRDTCDSSQYGSATLSEFMIKRGISSWTTQVSRVRKWELCRFWLQNCCIEHDKCRRYKRQTAFRPRRLVSVQRTGQGPISARLVCTSASDKPVEYLTLSHCWGRAESFTLVEQNLLHLLEDLAVNLLPKVFQDAFAVTLELGFSYIWIDSLCIIQDSRDDWLQQSSQMADIYENCSCNIAATGSRDGFRGLFIQEGTKDFVCYTVSRAWEDERSSTDDRQRTIDLWDASTSDWRSQVTEAPLNQRGWVLQESVLAPCVLHFGKEQLLWECSETRCCEMFPQGLPNSLCKGPLDTIKSMLLGAPNATPLNPRVGSRSGDARALQVPAIDQSHHASHFWHSLVAEYSFRSLTHAEDKLIAISAIVKRTRHRMQGRYLAGLWEQNFILDLLWRVSKVSILPFGRLKWAPSWSWASIDRTVFYDILSPNEYQTCAALRRAELTHPTSDDTGLVIVGRAQMKGFLLPVRPFKGFFMIDWWGYSVVNGELMRLLYIDYDDDGESLISGLSKPAQRLIKAPTHGTSRIIDRICANLPFITSRAQFIYLLPLLSKSPRGMQGLVLVPTGSVPGQYIRTGTFQMHLDDAAIIMKGSLKPLDPDLYEENLGGGEYVFSIV